MIGLAVGVKIRSLMVALGLVMLGFAVIAVAQTRADAAVTHGQVVPEMPRTDLPRVLDGKVLAHAQVGQRIFVAGDFQQVQLPGGSTVTQPYIFAYHIDTGEFDPNFRPVLNKLVRSLEPTPAGDGLYVGGLFTNWSGAFPIRIAKLDAEGNLDTTFNASASARVQSIAARGDKVFIGGDFTSVSGFSRIGLAALDAQTGAVDTGFSANVLQSVNPPSIVRRVKLTSDGNSLFALHHGNTVGGQTRQAIAKIDVSGATSVVTGWNIDWDSQGPKSCRNKLRDLAISPDDSFLVVGGQGADFAPNCDTVLRYPTAGNSTITYDWAARMYSSVFSVAVSDVAVYAGGHFCAAPKNPIPPGGISSTWPGQANGCDINDPFDPINPSQQDPDNAVFRKQLAALNPANGQALAWDPGSNAFLATFDLTLIDRGLLLGQDRDRYNDILTGRSGFMDFGVPADTEAPTIEATDPVPFSVVTNPDVLAGNAADNRTISSVTIRLKNVTTDQWLQPNGSFGPNMADLPVNLTPTGLGTADWSVAVANLPPGDYEIRGFSTDAVGNTSVPMVSPFNVPAAAGCTVALNAQDQVVVTWTGLDDGVITSVFVRRDGSWIANGAPGNSSYTDTTALPGDHSYVVRWRPGGVVMDEQCTPDPITVPPGGGPTCSVGLNGNNKPVLTWDAVAGVNNYNVREATGWIATVSGATTYTHTAATVGDHFYIVRYNQGGTHDITCMPSPINVPGSAACTVALTPEGFVDVSWTAVPGVTKYQVRDQAAGWIATVNNGLTYTDTDPETGARTYVIRHRMNGQNIDRICSPDPIIV